MTSQFMPVQFAARSTPQLKQSAPLYQHYPPQAQSNQCDDAAPGTSYPSDISKRSNVKQFFSNGPERGGDANEVWKLREENRAFHMRLAEINHSHQQQVSSLQIQLEQANAARQAAEQRLIAMTATAQAGRVAASPTMSPAPLPPPAPTQHSQPLVFDVQQQQIYQRQLQPFAPQQQYQQQQTYTYQQQQQAPVQSQQRRFHPYSRPQQQQPPPLPTLTCNGQPPRTFPHAAPAITSQAPQDDKKATGRLFAYCTGFISSSLPSSIGVSASVMPSTGIKAAPSWKFFGRSRANEDDEETGRAAPLLPLQTPPTAAGGALRDPTV